MSIHAPGPFTEAEYEAFVKPAREEVRAHLASCMERERWHEIRLAEKRRPKPLLWRGRVRAPPMPTTRRSIERNMVQRRILYRAVLQAGQRSATGFATSGAVYEEYCTIPMPVGHEHLTRRRVTDILKMMAADAMIRRHAYEGGRDGRTFLHAPPLQLPSHDRATEEA